MLTKHSQSRVRRDLVLEPESFRSPSPGLESLVAGWWADALGMDRIGADDDFFALGGDSLAAETIFAAIKGEFALEVPSATLLDAPTVATLATALRRLLAGDAARPGPEPLVLLKPGRGPALVLVPPRQQTELAYRRVAQRLAYPGPVLMLHHQPLASMAAVADAHLQAIAARGYGPTLHILGECWGALLTLEMLSRAPGAGFRTGLAVLFDPPPLLRRADRLRSRFGHLLPVVLSALVMDRLKGYWHDLRGASWPDRRAFLVQKGRLLVERLVRPASGHGLRAEVGSTLRSERERSRQNRDPLSRAGLAYAPRRPAVPVHLLLARDRGPGRFRDSREQWIRFLGVQDRVHEVPGQHTGDAVWAHPDELAAAIDRLLSG